MEKIMNTKSFILVSLIGFSSLASAATFQDTAKVINVEKIFRTHTVQEPYKDCYIEQVKKDLVMALLPMKLLVVFLVV